MKITRIIALLLIAVMALGIFAACSDEPEVIDPNAPPKALKASEIYKDGVDFEALKAEFGEGYNLYTSVIDFTSLSGKNITQKNGKLVCYRNNDTDPAKYMVYDIERSTDILSTEVEKTDSIYIGSNYISVSTYEANKVTIKTAIYNIIGEKLYEAYGSYSPSSIGDGLYRIGNAIYKTDENKVLVKVADTPMFLDSGIGYLYSIEGGYVSATSRVVTYFDAAFNVTAEYLIPGNYDTYNSAILADGKAFVIGVTEEDIYGDTYDYIRDGKKYSIDYLIFNPKDGKATAVTTLDGYLINNYVMNQVAFGNDEVGFYDIYSSNIINIIAAYKIVNKRIDTANPLALNIDNDGNIKGQLNAQVANQEDLPTPVGEYYRVESDSTIYFLDKNGSVVKKFATESLTEREYGYFDSYTKIAYSKNFEVLKDFSAYHIYSNMLTSIIYYNYDANGERNYYVWSTIGEKQILKSAGEIFDGVEDINDEIIVITTYNEATSTYYYHYYNYQGTLLFESESRYSTFIYGDDYIILIGRGDVNGESKTFYKKVQTA